MSGEVRRRAASAAVLAPLVAALLAAGCAQTLVDRAIAARGGPLPAWAREVRARVYQGVPGEWSWELAYRYPFGLRWTLHTWAEDQSYVYEGEGHAYLALGDAPIPALPGLERGLRSQARWVAVTSLDLLRDPERAEWSEIPAAALPPAVAYGLVARLRDGGSTYRLLFDRSARLVAAEGEVDLRPIGRGLLRASFDEFRPVGRYLLPFRVRYELAGRRLLDEEVVGYRVGPEPSRGVRALAGDGRDGAASAPERAPRGPSRSAGLAGRGASESRAGGDEPGQAPQRGPRTSGSSGPPSRR